mgnify:CR=1 FL=1
MRAGTRKLFSADVPLGVGGWEGGPGQFYHEMYACPNVRTEETFAFVNASAMQAFRAPFRNPAGQFVVAFTDTWPPASLSARVRQ